MSNWYPYVADRGYYDAIQAGSIDGTDDIPHDRAVVRASLARYSPNASAFPEQRFDLWSPSEDPAKATLFVGRLPRDVNYRQLRKAMARLMTASMSRRDSSSPPRGDSRSRRRHSPRQRSRSPFAGRHSPTESGAEENVAVDRDDPWPLVRVVTNVITGEPCGYAFVALPTAADAERMLQTWRRASRVDRSTDRRRAPPTGYNRHSGRHPDTEADLTRIFRGVTGWEQIILEPAFSRTLPGWKPRSLGGGLGGRKESGQLRFGGIARPFRRPFTFTGPDTTT
ncbi:hypothetical protein AAHC03_04837 [Spirometra sp. Aus1]